MQSSGGKLVVLDFRPFCGVADLLYNSAFVAERYAGIRDFLEHEVLLCNASLISLIPCYPFTVLSSSATLRDFEIIPYPSKKDSFLEIMRQSRFPYPTVLSKSHEQRANLEFDCSMLLILAVRSITCRGLKFSCSSCSQRLVAEQWRRMSEWKG